MADDFLKDDDEQLKALRDLAPAGFVVALNVDWSGPQLLHSEFSPEWRTEYEEKNYFILDPVFYWTITNRGRIRWSEIKLPDVANVSGKAASHGMKYGAVLSERASRSRSFLTAARSDREFTEPEMERLSEIFRYCINTLIPVASLSEFELNIIKLLQGGKTTTETAKEIDLSEKEVKAYISSAMDKLEVKNRKQLVSSAEIRGLI